MEHEKPYGYPSMSRESRSHLDYSDDLAARVRQAKEAAQKELEAFGDASEYEIRKICGQRTDITYNDEEGNTVVLIKPEPGNTAPLDSSRKDTRKNVDRQISLEFSTVSVQRKEQ
jgi:hypothetical protein